MFAFTGLPAPPPRRAEDERQAAKRREERLCAMARSPARDAAFGARRPPPQAHLTRVRQQRGQREQCAERRGPNGEARQKMENEAGGGQQQPRKRAARRRARRRRSVRRRRQRPSAPPQSSPPRAKGARGRRGRRQGPPAAGAGARSPPGRGGRAWRRNPTAPGRADIGHGPARAAPPETGQQQNPRQGIEQRAPERGGRGAQGGGVGRGDGAATHGAGEDQLATDGGERRRARGPAKAAEQTAREQRGAQKRAQRRRFALPCGAQMFVGEAGEGQRRARQPQRPPQFPVGRGRQQPRPEGGAIAAGRGREQQRRQQRPRPGPAPRAGARSPARRRRGTPSPRRACRDRPAPRPPPAPPSPAPAPPARAAAAPGARTAPSAAKVAFASSFSSFPGVAPVVFRRILVLRAGEGRQRPFASAPRRFSLLFPRRRGRRAGRGRFFRVFRAAVFALHAGRRAFAAGISAASSFCPVARSPSPARAAGRAPACRARPLTPCGVRVAGQEKRPFGRLLSIYIAYAAACPSAPVSRETDRGGTPRPCPGVRAIRPVSRETHRARRGRQKRICTENMPVRAVPLGHAEGCVLAQAHALALQRHGATLLRQRGEVVFLAEVAEHDLPGPAPDQLHGGAPGVVVGEMAAAARVCAA